MTMTMSAYYRYIFKKTEVHKPYLIHEMAKMIEKLIAKVVSTVKERAASFYPAFLL